MHHGAIGVRKPPPSITTINYLCGKVWHKPDPMCQRSYLLFPLYVLWLIRLCINTQSVLVLLLLYNESSKMGDYLVCQH